MSYPDKLTSGTICGRSQTCCASTGIPCSVQSHSDYPASAPPGPTWTWPASPVTVVLNLSFECLYTLTVCALLSSWQQASMGQVIAACGHPSGASQPAFWIRVASPPHIGTIHVHVRIHANIHAQAHKKSHSMPLQSKYNQCWRPDLEGKLLKPFTHKKNWTWRTA